MKIFRIFLVIFICSGSAKLSAQSDTYLYWDPQFTFKISTNTRWTHSFGFVNRTLHYKKVKGESFSDANQEHIELNHFTNYKTGSNTAVSFGLRYRFREVFNDSRYDEFRTIEQFVYKQPGSSIGLAHRFRAEQRFRNVVTVQRVRYRIGIAQALGEDFSVGLSTEALYSVANERKPELEQRIAFKLNNSSLKNLDIDLNVEYHHDNYIYNLEKKFFVATGITVKL